jgi:hypothetical protein
MLCIFTSVVILFVLFFLVDIILYFIFAYALFVMAKDKNIDNFWMAWIPILQLYILGRLVESIKILDYEIPRIELAFPLFGVVAIILNKVPILGMILSLLYFIFTLIVLNKLYKIYDEDKATVFTILSIFGFPVPFIFMYLKDIKN